MTISRTSSRRLPPHFHQSPTEFSKQIHRPSYASSHVFFAIHRTLGMHSARFGRTNCRPAGQETKTAERIREKEEGRGGEGKGQEIRGARNLQSHSLVRKKKSATRHCQFSGRNGAILASSIFKPNDGTMRPLSENTVRGRV